ncbi:MAG: hypothetical protein WBE45_09610, partial [Terriglobales bacterium]
DELAQRREAAGCGLAGGCTLWRPRGLLLLASGQKNEGENRSESRKLHGINYFRESLKTAWLLCRRANMFALDDTSEGEWLAILWLEVVSLECGL